MAKINVGICCMKKKLNSDSMAELLQRLQATGKFVIIRFKESMILHEPVENWPVVSCLLAFASTGFPLPKAIQYPTSSLGVIFYFVYIKPKRIVNILCLLRFQWEYRYQKLRNPWLVNALEEQEILTDRVQMYARLSESWFRV